MENLLPMKFATELELVNLADKRGIIIAHCKNLVACMMRTLRFALRAVVEDATHQHARILWTYGL
jgi:hypothetical protein